MRDSWRGLVEEAGDEWGEEWMLGEFWCLGPCRSHGGVKNYPESKRGRKFAEEGIFSSAHLVRIARRQHT